VSTYWLSTLGAEPFEPPPTLPSETDAVVVGGGLMGVATAYWLARARRSVLLVEAERLCGGATGRNAGLMLPSSSTLEEPRLLQQVLADEAIQAEYETPGHLALASSEPCWEAFQSEAAQSRERGGSLQALDLTSCEDLVGRRLSSLFLGGRWFPRGSVVHSARLVLGLARAAERHGAVVAVGTRALEVTGKAAKDRLFVTTTRGRVEARHVVYACNFRTAALVPELAAVFQPTVAQVLSTAPLPPVFRIGLGVDWGSIYWRQVPGGSIVLGGGSRPLSDDGSGADDLDAELQERLEGFLARAFPGFPELTVSGRWAGVMDYSKDGRPVVGPLDGDLRRWVVAGFGGHGMPAGLSVGKGIAEGITSGQVPAPLTPLAPSRFEELR
jgi:gamma-glutamylputrescine oxidase